MITKVLGGVRGLVPVFGVAVAVALLGTVTGYVWDHVHKVVAEEQVSHGTPATDLHNGSQLLAINGWGVQAALPLAAELPLVSYAMQSADVVGLSAADLAKLGAACQAGNNALGTITRYPAGTYVPSGKVTLGANVVATVGQYDFVYQFPQNDCADQNAGMTIINRETPIILEALGSMTGLNAAPVASPEPASAQ
ncbi:MAG TPA: hypothetical protein VI322_01810 [Candidatus Saccharimonadia bacterium]